MELKSCYKQTEVGQIPEDWRVETINHLLEDKSILGHLDGNHGELYPRSSEFKQSGVPYIGANDFAEGIVTFERCKFLTNERASQFRKGVAKDGDVLFAHNATVGPVALLRTSESFVILSTTATYFRCNEEKLSNLYLKSALQSLHFVKQYQAVMAQSTRFQVPITAQRKLLLVVPPITEQRAIAGALRDVDALIGALDKLIAKKRGIKQAAMQQLLTGKQRLPEFHGEWEVKRLGSLGLFRGGGGFPTVHQGDTEGDYPFFKVSDMNNEGNSTFMISSNNWISESVRKQIGANTFPANTIVFAKIGAAVFLERKKILVQESCLDNNMMGFVLDDGAAYPRFIHYLFLTIQLGKLVATTALPSINGREIARLEYSIPSLPEQKAIAIVLSDMDAEIAATEQRRDKTRALKQGMMQELLTGRTRLV